MAGVPDRETPSSAAMCRGQTFPRQNREKNDRSSLLFSSLSSLLFSLIDRWMDRWMDGPGPGPDRLIDRSVLLFYFNLSHYYYKLHSTLLAGGLRLRCFTCGETLPWAPFEPRGTRRSQAPPRCTRPDPTQSIRYRERRDNVTRINIGHGYLYKLGQGTLWRLDSQKWNEKWNETTRLGQTAISTALDGIVRHNAVQQWGPD